MMTMGAPVPRAGFWLALVLIAQWTGVVPLGAASAQLGVEVPPYSAAQPDAPPVTRGNLLQSERFWPYRVQLIEPWSAGEGTSSIPKGVLGVLVRVEGEGVARIDFGREGIHDVLVEATDLVARANRIRLGESDKLAPNFVHKIGTRLVDSSGEAPRNHRFADLMPPKVFLAVFADPRDQGFSGLAKALRSLRDREGLQTILFAQGRHPSGPLHQKLAGLDWRVPFVFDHMAEAYARSLRGAEAPIPAVMLQSPEGRVLFRSVWAPGETREALEAAIEGALGGGDADAAVASPRDSSGSSQPRSDGSPETAGSAAERSGG